MHWMKKPFVLPTSKFTGSFLAPPTYSELEPIDYFYSMFGKESFDILKDQANLYSVQVNPNRPMNIFDTDIRQFIGIFNHFRRVLIPTTTFLLDGWYTRTIHRLGNEPRSIFINKKVFIHDR